MAKSKENLYGQEKNYNFKKNCSEQELDYRNYFLKKQEYVQYTGIWVGISLIFSYTFYHRLWVAFIGIFFLPFYLGNAKKRLQVKRQCVLRGQFRDAIQFMEGYLRTGYSVENAMERSGEDLFRMWGKNAYMTVELGHMIGQMNLNVSVEEVWDSFAQRSGVFQIEQFACIFRVAKRMGGNVSSVIRSSMVQIREQIRAEEEIRTILASRTLQMQVMNFVPVGILLYVGTVSSDLLQVMYETMVGRMIMTLCLGIYVAAYGFGKHMMQKISEETI